MKKNLKRYSPLVAAAVINLLMLALRPEAGIKALRFTSEALWHVMLTLPPVFLLTGLMDAWAERETVERLIGRGSGVRGILIAFLLGMITAAPIYALLPVAGLLLKKGCPVFYALIFFGSSASLRIPLLLFEASAMGWAFTLTRCVTNIIGVLAIALIADKILRPDDKRRISEQAAKQPSDTPM